MRPHVEAELAALSYLAVLKPGALLGFAIEREGLDVSVAWVGAVDVDLEELAVAEIDGSLLEEWRPEDVVTADSVDGVVRP